MRARNVVASLFALLIAPALASAQSIVWVSAGRDIREVTTATGASKSVHLSAGTSVGHMVYGPDGRIYFGEFFATESCVSRVHPTGSVSKTTGLNATYVKVACSAAVAKRPGELRFDSTGALLFATVSAGVQKIGASALAGALPVTPASVSQIITSTNGSALDHAHNGDVLYTEGNTLKSFGNSLEIHVDGTPVAVDVVTGGEGSVVPLVPPDKTEPFPTGAICVSSLNIVRCYGKNGAELGDIHAFPASDNAQGWAFTKNDTAWVATSVDPTQTITGRNGVLWRVDSTGAKTVYPTKFTGKQPPIISVAVPPTSKTVTKTPVMGTYNFVFGSDALFITTPQNCTLQVTAKERLASEVQSCLDTVTPKPPTRSLATYLGESFPTEYEVIQVGSQNCIPQGTEATQLITAFFPWPSNLALIRRPSNSNTCVSNTTGIYAFAAPLDAGVRGGSNSFSGFMGAQVNQGAQVPTLTLLSPLQNAPVVESEPIDPQDIADAVEQNRGNVAVKFSLTQNGSPVITNDAVFSVQRLVLDESGAINPQFSPICNVQPQDTPTGPPRFFITSENTYRFNLDTSGMTPFDCTLPGLYAFGISFPVDGIAPPITFLVRLK